MKMRPRRDRLTLDAVFSAAYATPADTNYVPTKRLLNPGDLRRPKKHLCPFLENHFFLRSFFVKYVTGFALPQAEQKYVADYQNL